MSGVLRNSKGSVFVPMWLVFVLGLTLTVQGVQCHSNAKRSADRMNDDDVTTCSCRGLTQSTHMTCRTPIDGCGVNETDHDGSCYKFFTEVHMSRDNSHLKCIKRHSHLVYIDMVGEQTFLTNTFKGLSGGDFWIGLTPLLFTWGDGSRVLPDLLPIFGSGDSCFYLSVSNMRIMRGSCSTTRQFICEQAARSGTSNDGCPRNYKNVFGSSCYRMYDASRWTSWWYANDKCHLLYIQSQAELDAVLDEYSITSGGFWIGGLTQPLGWMDGVLPWTDFAAISNGYEENRCFRLPREGNYVYYDLCSNTYSFICERRLDSPHNAHNVSSCPPSLPVDLIRLGHSGSLCIYFLSDESSPPVLVECDSLDGVDECGCVRDTDRSG